MAKHTNKIKKNDEISFKIVAYALVIFCTIIAALPFYVLIIGSFTPEKQFHTTGLSLWPSEFTLSAYQYIFKSPEKILNGYKVTIFITVVGTVMALFLTAMTAYALNRKEFRPRNIISFYFYFTTMFGAGMVPRYLLITQYLHMKNTIWVQIIPVLLAATTIIMMRNFVNGIPDSIAESGRVDGASEFTIFLRLYLPLMKSGLACIGLMTALGYWNRWDGAMLYIEDETLYPLQYLLYQMTSSAQFLANAVSESGLPNIEIPSQALKLAMTVITIGPIAFVYPFIQKHFIKGITIGAVKG